MDRHRYFHICTHEIKRDPYVGQGRTLIIDSPSRSFIHTIIENARVLRIKEVRAISFDVTEEKAALFFDNQDPKQFYDNAPPDDVYYDIVEDEVDYASFFLEGEDISEPLPETFFEPVLHNRIRWTVTPPTRYLIVADVRFNHLETERFSLQNCPLCSGKGWYVDVLSVNNSFEYISGIERIAQRFVKDFFTKEGTNIIDRSYGTSVVEDLQRGDASKDEYAFNLIRSVVSDIEEDYLNNQQDFISELNPNEILVSFIIDDVTYVGNKQSTLMVKVRIVTQESEEIFQFGFT